jgi:dinuclear metal center YbgI/SA1388 family protein
MQRAELDAYLNRFLEVARFQDYCPNGLQVEGRAEIGSIVTGVTASLDLLRAADACGADALIVHHGYFWRGEDARVTGMRRKRLAYLIEKNLNLFAFHLPLDAHAEIGNNIQLARALGFTVNGQFAPQDIALYGDVQPALSVAALAERIAERLQRAPTVIGEQNKTVRRVAWCTGAAQSFFEDAIALGVDAYISGEISEQTVHAARESGVVYLAAGHHATERYGVRALGEHLAGRFGLRHEFVDIPNPV